MGLSDGQVPTPAINLSQTGGDTDWKNKQERQPTELAWRGVTSEIIDCNDFDSLEYKKFGGHLDFPGRQTTKNF